MNQQNLPDCDDAREFIAEVHSIINFWRKRPLLTDRRTDPTRARLLGCAADIIRLIDSADARGWDIRDIAYRVNEERDIDLLLAIPKAELRERVDEAMKEWCREHEGYDEQVMNGEARAPTRRPNP
jgi:hypothetical protein